MYSKSTSPSSGHTASVLCAIAQISLQETSYVHQTLGEIRRWLTRKIFTKKRLCYGL